MKSIIIVILISVTTKNSTQKSVKNNFWKVKKYKKKQIKEMVKKMSKYIAETILRIVVKGILKKKNTERIFKGTFKLISKI